MFFFAYCLLGFFLGGSGSLGFVCVFVCLGYHSFGPLEGPVPREEEEGEHGALTRFREEGVE